MELWAIILPSSDIIEVFEVLELVYSGPDLGAARDEPVFTLPVEG